MILPKNISKHHGLGFFIEKNTKFTYNKIEEKIRH